MFFLSRVQLRGSLSKILFRTPSCPSLVERKGSNKKDGVGYDLILQALYLLQNTRFLYHKPQVASKTNLKKTLFHWVNLMFNRVSEDRVKEVGPDLACAEWLLRNGAQIQWKGSEKFTKDYNELPYDQRGKRRDSQPFHIFGIKASNATIMANGFPHFNGCHYIDNIVLRRCNLLSNDALPHLQLLNNSLKILEINSCPNISDEGILSLTMLRNLKVLKLVNLPEVKNKNAMKEKLKEALRSTQLSFNDEINDSN